ncbi:MULTISPECIES: hypothetical protein [Planktothricoides]|uniref:Transposase n=2 Tax=Planktothricoides raciborskii TaxID=132608 RepID=A0AAU8JKK3_9CYAN|nr:MULTISPECIES: hypothetical protein [Planktothricoides]KOR36922.1 hypothetical protein AM228_10135 [Planktothricoides sp. SR001]MBD2546228.1 hypothetical protein [Planktothricoides raciborskii FACHB-1370]MBD2584502.1 hypothetical protein [Planktothricoides raciborskii FACHB-1261]
MEVQKETRFLRQGAIAKKRNRVSVVDIIVNCGVTERNPVSQTRRDRSWSAEVGVGAIAWELGVGSKG